MFVELNGQFNCTNVLKSQGSNSISDAGCWREDEHSAI